MRVPSRASALSINYETVSNLFLIQIPMELKNDTKKAIKLMMMYLWRLIAGERKQNLV